MGKNQTLQEFWRQQAAWSNATFGLDSERGPIGPTKHLLKEVNEVLEHLEAGTYEAEKLLEEFADCLFLLFDAVRRAGFVLPQLIKKAFWKLAKNKLRVWPKPTSDEPVEHVKGVHD
jgi:NTP pyrophosphatase (non-canonical NTP hydrolase)